MVRCNAQDVAMFQSSAILEELRAGIADFVRQNNSLDRFPPQGVSSEQGGIGNGSAYIFFLAALPIPHNLAVNQT